MSRVYEDLADFYWSLRADLWCIWREDRRFRWLTLTLLVMWVLAAMIWLLGLAGVDVEGWLRSVGVLQ